MIDSKQNTFLADKNQLQERKLIVKRQMNKFEWSPELDNFLM
jgi:hypothetical protein